MGTKVTIELPNNVYQQAQEFARLHRQKVEEAIPALIEQGLAAGKVEEEIADWSEPDPDVDREMEAYIALHPTLKEMYFGKYVAIYHGVLIDHDDDPAELLTRIDARYPNEFVWVTEVGPEPIETIVVRSPRLVRD